MTQNDTTRFTDFLGRTIRLTQERLSHLLEHPEMTGQLARIEEVLAQPDIIVNTAADQSVFVYHRYYQTTPVSSKFLLVVVKYTIGDAFILTAFFSNRQKKGAVVWQK